MNKKTSPIVSRLAPLDELTLPPQAGEGLPRLISCYPPPVSDRLKTFIRQRAAELGFDV